jgi:trans-aconitate methyltransferase
MDGYGRDSYGEAFADVYDDWYRDVSDVGATVQALVGLAGEDPVLELGVGTGRLALPLTNEGLDVHGIDSSTAMLERLARKDPGGRVHLHVGDMVDDLPPGPFSLVFAAYNTFFNLTDRGRQAACLHAVAQRLSSGGRFVVEAFVPELPPRSGSDVSVKALTATRVVLSVSLHRPDEQTAEGQFVEFTESGGVRLRPWAIRYCHPAELDSMAGDAGLVLQHRWTTFDDHRFDQHSDRHVSVYGLDTS